MSFIRKATSRSTVAKDYKCTIRLLDDNDSVQCEFTKNDTGMYLLDYICDYLSIVEKDYFGLRFMDSTKQRYWLDLAKPIKGQIKGILPNVQCVFSFRVKFYPRDPAVLREEVTRYQLYLQLRRDLMHGRLYCPQSEAVWLGAFILQAEIGDYSPDDCQSGYVSEYKILPRQNEKLEDKIAEHHRSSVICGLNPEQAEYKFLSKASLLDTYGFDPLHVKESKVGAVYLGATCRGILVYQSNRKLHHFAWDQVEKIDYIGKDFLLYQRVSKEKKDVVKHVYICPSGKVSKHLWKFMLEQKGFFTADHAADVKSQVAHGVLPFIRKARFRYSGRVFNEIMIQPIVPRDQPIIRRYTLERQSSHSERGSMSNGVGKYNTLPKSFGRKHEESGQNKSAKDRASLFLETSFDNSVGPPLTTSSPRSTEDTVSDVTAARHSTLTSNVANESAPARLLQTAPLAKQDPLTESLFDLGYQQSSMTKDAAHLHQVQNGSVPLKEERVVEAKPLLSTGIHQYKMAQNGGPLITTPTMTTSGGMSDHRCLRLLFASALLAGLCAAVAAWAM